MKIHDLPVHKLELSTAIGVELQYFEMDDSSDSKMETMGAHRDDHYLFFSLKREMLRFRWSLKKGNVKRGHCTMFYHLRYITG